MIIVERIGTQVARCCAIAIAKPRHGIGGQQETLGKLRKTGVIRAVVGHRKDGRIFGSGTSGTKGQVVPKVVVGTRAI